MFDNLGLEREGAFTAGYKYGCRLHEMGVQSALVMIEALINMRSEETKDPCPRHLQNAEDWVWNIATTLIVEPAFPPHDADRDYRRDFIRGAMTAIENRRPTDRPVSARMWRPRLSSRVSA